MSRGENAETDGAEPTKPGVGTPAGEALDRAERAFELGDFAAVRQLTRPLFTAEPFEVAEAARSLHRRVSVDPAQIAVVLFCFALLAFVVGRFVV
jgi:hypothetical protein